MLATHRPLALRLFNAAALPQQVFLAVLGVALITAGAKINVPMWPVPMTLATLAVLLIGASYGLRLGAATVAAYLALGAAGAPVFTSPGAGPLYFAGPTGGYLLGYLVAAIAMGLLAHFWRAERGTRLAASLALGSVVIFILGTTHLAWFLGLEQGALLWTEAIVTGVLPFLPGAIVKAALAFALLTLMRRRVDQQSR